MSVDFTLKRFYFPFGTICFLKEQTLMALCCVLDIIILIAYIVGRRGIDLAKSAIIEVLTFR